MKGLGVRGPIFRAACALAVLLSAVCPVSGRRIAYTQGPGVSRVSDSGAEDGMERARELLRGLSSTLRGMEPYDMSFCVETGDYSAEGDCIVQGDRYCLLMEGLEVYGDGATRWEVYDDRREILIDRADPSACNLIDDPTRAFDFAESDFDIALLSEERGRAVVWLCPRDGVQTLSALEIVIDTERLLPLSIEYNFDGEHVRIRLPRIVPTSLLPPRYDSSRYPGYEVIDFR